MKPYLALVAALLASPVAAVHVRGAPRSDFDQKAAALFTKEYSFHAWDPTDHTVEGEDWSLPPWVKPARFSGIQISEKLVPAEFPGRIQRSVRASWRETEPVEGTFDFSALRQEILKESEGGRFAVKMGLGASVWETRYFQSLQDRTLRKTESGTAPRWLKEHGIPLIEEPPNKSIPFQVVNMDIYHPEYHRRYLKLVGAFGRSGIPQMKELDICYLHLVSASRGEEGAGPPVGDPRRTLFEERMRAWAEAFKGVAHKLCLVSAKEDDMALALKLGMGQRNGFVEHYLMHAPNPGLGQELDADGYLVVNEQCPLIAENRASGDENEEYTAGHVERFGPIETFPHRYRESTLRMLQMRRNFVWAEGGPWLINPPLLHYMALELGKTVHDAPDAWCYLRESVVKGGKNGRPVKNFERWLYQRDADGARTEADREGRGAAADVRIRQGAPVRPDRAKDPDGQGAIHDPLRGGRSIPRRGSARGRREDHLPRPGECRVAAGVLRRRQDGRDAQGDLRRLGRGQDGHLHSQRRLLPGPGTRRDGLPGQGREPGRRGAPASRA
jgi:hypothetical protein